MNSVLFTEVALNSRAAMSTAAGAVPRRTACQAALHVGPGWRLGEVWRGSVFPGCGSLAVQGEGNVYCEIVTDVHRLRAPGTCGAREQNMRQASTDTTGGESCKSRCSVRPSVDKKESLSIAFHRSRVTHGKYTESFLVDRRAPTQRGRESCRSARPLIPRTCKTTC